MRAATQGTRRLGHRAVARDSKGAQENLVNRVREEDRQVPFWRLIACPSTIALLQIVSAPTRAQLDKATVNGTVSDQSGAAVPGAHVAARNLETGVQYRGTTNDAGIY